MHARTYSAAAAIAALLAFGLGTDASAATYIIDPGTVTLTGVDACYVGFSKKDCELQGTIKGGTFDLTTVNQQETLNNLFDWQIVKTSGWAVGGGAYTVSATLNFSSPSSESSGPNGGSAWFVTGLFSAGGIDWDPGFDFVEFDDGSKISYDLHDASKFGLGTSAQTGATFTLVQGPAPVPLPASALLLLVGVGAIGGLRARKSRKAA